MDSTNSATVPELRRRWFQLRLRTWLVVILIVSGALAWYVQERSRLANYRTKLRSIGGHLSANNRAQPRWHLWLFGEDPHFYVADFYVNANCGDESLSLLRNLKNLTDLSLSNTQITDDGLLLLKGFPKLKDLRLKNTQITDAGMEHLKECPAYRLDVSGTKVTRDGISNYLKARPRVEIRW